MIKFLLTFLQVLCHVCQFQSKNITDLTHEGVLTDTDGGFAIHAQALDILSSATLTILVPDVSAMRKDSFFYTSYLFRVCR